MKMPSVVLLVDGKGDEVRASVLGVEHRRVLLAPREEGRGVPFRLADGFPVGGARDGTGWRIRSGCLQKLQLAVAAKRKNVTS